MKTPITRGNRHQPASPQSQRWGRDRRANRLLSGAARCNDVEDLEDWEDSEDRRLNNLPVFNAPSGFESLSLRQILDYKQLIRKSSARILTQRETKSDLSSRFPLGRRAGGGGGAIRTQVSAALQGPLGAIASPRLPRCGSDSSRQHRLQHGRAKPHTPGQCPSLRPSPAQLLR